MNFAFRKMKKKQLKCEKFLSANCIFEFVETILLIYDSLVAINLLASLKIVMILYFSIML